MFKRKRSNGGLEIKDPQYLTWLHALHREGRLPVLALEGVPTGGKMELHHTDNPWGGKPRDVDAGVVPLSQQTHSHFEQSPGEERVFKRLEAVWASFAYWCYRSGYEPDVGAAKRFLAWTLEKLKEDFHDAD